MNNVYEAQKMNDNVYEVQEQTTCITEERTAIKNEREKRKGKIKERT